MKKFLLALIVLIPLGALAAYRINAKIDLDQTAKARAKTVTIPVVTTEALARRSIQAKVLITGSVRPEHEVDITPKASGRVVKVNANLGDHVKAGQVLVQIEQEVSALQLKQASAALQMAQANLANAQKNAESAEMLDKSHNIPDVQLVGARSGLQAAKAQVLQAEAQLGLATEALKNTRVTSPIDGVITRKNVNVGSMASPGGMGPQPPLFQVQDLKKLKLEASIDEKEVPLVSLGQPVRFSVDAYPGQEFTGTVARLSHSLDATSRRAAIEVAIDNVDEKLYANMFARGQISQKEATEVLALPQTALVKEATTPSVYVTEGKTVKLRPITLGETDGVYVAVRDGLKEGETVVLSGQSRLTDGMEVSIQAPASQPRN